MPCNWPASVMRMLGLPSTTKAADWCNARGRLGAEADKGGAGGRFMEVQGGWLKATLTELDVH